jgi:hypothetical protein
MARRTVATRPSGDRGGETCAEGKLGTGERDPLSIPEEPPEPISRMLVLMANICVPILTEPAPNQIPTPTSKLAAIALPAEKRLLGLL